MPSIKLGFTPIGLDDLTLSKDANFFTTFTNATGWADGITIEIRFPEPDVDPDDWVTWPADITSTVATWNVPVDQVNAAVAVVNSIGGSGRARARVHYIDADGTDLLWMEGPTYVV